MGVLVAKKKNATVRGFSETLTSINRDVVNEMSSPDEVTTVPANVTAQPNGEQNPAFSSQQGKAQDGA